MSKEKRFMDEVREVMGLRHYSLHTERSYSDWIRRYVKFHGMKSREDLVDGERKIEDFLTHLAVEGGVAPSTQNQAMNALVFFYRKVLRQSQDEKIDAVRAQTKRHVPGVMTREEVAQVLALMEGTPQLVAKILYGSGLRVQEAVGLRVQDVDFGMKQITVRSGKGNKDRVTTFPASMVGLLENHLRPALGWR